MRKLRMGRCANGVEWGAESARVVMPARFVPYRDLSKTASGMGSGNDDRSQVSDGLYFLRTTGRLECDPSENHLASHRPLKIVFGGVLLVCGFAVG